MKKIRIFSILIIIVLLSLIINSCGRDAEKKVKISDLILNKEKINKLWIDKGNDPALPIQKTLIIGEVLKKVSDISVQKLSKKEDTSFWEDKESEEEKLILIDFHEEGYPASGELLIWEDGTILTFNNKSMQSAVRTISYLSTEKYPDLYKWLIKISEVKSTDGITVDMPDIIPNQ